MALKIVSGLDATSLSLSSFLDLQKNELRSAQIHNLNTTQINGITSPASGQFAYDTTLNKLKVYNGTVWELVGASADETTITLSSNTLTIKALGVATGLIANLAVTSGKLAAGAVGTAKIADGAISTIKIADDQITAATIANDAVGAAAIADNSVDIARLNVTDGTAGQFLKTDGSGALAFATHTDQDVSPTNLVTQLAALDTTHAVNVHGSGATNIIIGSGTQTPNVQVTGNVIVDGDLTVGGTTTTINSTTVTIDDPIFTLGGDTAPTADDNKDRGIEFKYHSGDEAHVGFFGYDDSAASFVFLTDATNTSEVFSGTNGNITIGQIDIRVASGLQLGGVAVTSTAAELNKLDGFTGTYEDLNYAKALKATGVTNTEFDYLDGVTSSIQTQLNSKPIAYAADVTTSSGTVTIAQSAHGLTFPSNVQVYDENGQLVLVDIRQVVSGGDLTITINAPDATYSIIAVGAPAA